MKIRFWIALLLIFLAHPLSADDSILVADTDTEFMTAIDNLKDAIAAQGYTVAHVQKCDRGLTSMGYKSELYRVVFFGRHEEVQRISAEHPELIPFLPFKMLIHTNKGGSSLAIINPELLKTLTNDPWISEMSSKWHDDFVVIQQNATKPIPQ